MIPWENVRRFLGFLGFFGFFGLPEPKPRETAVSQGQGWANQGTSLPRGITTGGQE